MSTRPFSLPGRLTLTLIICLLGAAVALVALFLPARSTASSGADDGPSYGNNTGGDDTHQMDADADAQPADADADAGAPADLATDEVRIEAFAFTAVATLEPGQELTVVNNDSAPHTLTANDGSFNTGLLQPGESAVIVVPTEAGEFSFFCELHPSMTGALTVSA